MQRILAGGGFDAGGAEFVWQGVVGTALLYGALLAHMTLGLWALYARRYFRWTRAEILQLVLGLAFPALLANHLAVTRTALTLYGLNKGYAAELASLWVTAPRTGWLQMAVLLAAWGHGCLGLGFLLRLRRWYPAWQPTLLAAAVLVPVLTLLGFVEGGREIARAMAEPGFVASHLSPAVVGSALQKAHLAALRDGFLVAYGGVVLLVLGARGADTSCLPDAGDGQHAGLSPDPARIRYGICGRPPQPDTGRGTVCGRHIRGSARILRAGGRAHAVRQRLSARAFHCQRQRGHHRMRRPAGAVPGRWCAGPVRPGLRCGHGLPPGARCGRRLARAPGGDG